LQDYRIYRIGFPLAKLRVNYGQDYKIYRINCVGLNWGLNMDRMAGLQDLQDRVLMLSRALTMDRIAGLQDLQDRLFWLSWGLTMDRMAGFKGFTG
jgi:hypothetical protein